MRGWWYYEEIEVGRTRLKLAPGFSCSAYSSSSHFFIFKKQKPIWGAVNGALLAMVEMLVFRSVAGKAVVHRLCPQ